MDSEISIDLQVGVSAAADTAAVPGFELLRQWVAAAARSAGIVPRGLLTLRFVDEKEGRALNRTWRGRDHSTNVLAFEGPPTQHVSDESAGDIVICIPVVRREAEEQQKQLAAHLAHMVVHGTLHLLGYRHDEEADAKRMESLERSVLVGLGFPDPYSAEHA